MMEKLPIAEAAAQLGLSPNAVRKRIRRGTLAADKDGDQWYVLLADGRAGRPTPPARPRPSPLRPTPATDQINLPRAVPRVEAVPANPETEGPAVPALMELLQQERAERQQERERRSQSEQAAAMWQERARNLEAENAKLQELLALPTHEEEPSARWWQWWRRKGQYARA